MNHKEKILHALQVFIQQKELADALRDKLKTARREEDQKRAEVVRVIQAVCGAKAVVYKGVRYSVMDSEGLTSSVFEDVILD